MSQHFGLTCEKRSELLREAVLRRMPAVVTCRLSEGWVRFSSRFCGLDEQAGYLLLKCPAGAEHALPGIAIGQSVSVSFRRGSRKLVFDTAVIECGASGVDHSAEEALLRLQWPSDMHELQRRLYHRTAVPRGTVIPVDIWAEGGKERDPRGATPARGTMLDLSAGGLSLALPAERRFPGDANKAITCRFATGPNGFPVEISAIQRHQQSMPDGRVRVGLQFVGLDACAQGRAAIRRIHQLATRLQRGGGRQSQTVSD